MELTSDSAIRRRVRLLLVATSVVLSVVTYESQAEGAAPQGPWLPPTNLSNTDRGSASPDIAIAPDGTATAVWYRSNGLLQTTTRPPGGSFGTATDLPGSGSEAEAPRIATALDGTATVIWRRAKDSNTFVISAATRPPGGSFGAPVDISAPASRNPDGLNNLYGLDIAVADDGTTTVAWVRRNDGSSRTVEATTRPPGGSFGTPVTISATGVVEGALVIAVANDGTATVVWRASYGPGDDVVVEAATRSPGGSFGAPIAISTPAGGIIGPDIAVADDSTTTVVWSRQPTSMGSPPYVAQAATRLPGGSFGAPVDLSQERQGIQPPSIAIAPDGTATAVWSWSSADGGPYIHAVMAATRPPGGSFGAPVNISTPGQYFENPIVAVADDGTVTVISIRTDGANTLHAATRPLGGSFGPQVDISGGGDDASQQIAIAPDGTATVVWFRRATKPFIRTASTQAPKFSLEVTKGGSGTGTVTSEPGGIDCGTDCSEDFTSYTQVSLSAIPFAGNRFTGWSGAGCSGTGACQVTVTSDQTATATFTAVEHTLTVVRSGKGQGTITSSPTGISCGTTCWHEYAEGTQVTLTANPKTGSMFTGWSGAGCSGTGACQVTVTSDQTATATIALSKARISKVKVGGPKKIKLKKKVAYKVKITNSGNATANGVRLKVSGKGVSLNKSVGKIGAKKTRTVKVKFRPKKPGMVKVTFKVNSKNAGGKTPKKTIRVRK